MIATKTPVPWWDIVTPELVEEYVELTRTTRLAQRHYRETQSPFVRRRAAELELQLDALGDRIHAAIVAARPADPAAVQEGGAL